MKLGDKLVQLRKEKRNTRDKFAQLLGISKYTLRNYELGITEPGHPFLIKIAGLFDTSTDYILGLTEEREKMHSYELKISEFEQIKKYRALDLHGKDMVDTVLNKEHERCQTVNQNNSLPLVEESTSDYFVLNAAYADSDHSNAPKEQKQMEGDIMDKENYKK